MREFRCKSCHKLLAKIEGSIPVKMTSGLEFESIGKENERLKPTTYRQEDLVVHIKCPKCGVMNSRVKEIRVFVQV